MNILRCRCKSKCALSKEQLDDIAEDVMCGKLVVYPTDTVYGIGTSIFNEAAVKRIYVAKKRPFDMPLSVAVSNTDMINDIAVVDEHAKKLIDAFLPGPLTIIIKKRPEVPDIVTAMSEKVGIRIPDHSIAIEIINRTGPLVATSANLHSHPDATNVEDAVRDLGDSVETYVDCGPSMSGKPSTIVWLMDGKLEIVRQGTITKKQIEDVLNA